MKYISFITALLFICSSCLNDNYDGPNANFHGKIIDVETGEPVQSEQPNGFQIRFTEVSWGTNAQAQSFWGMQDGSFNWDYLFGYEGSKYQGSPYKVATYVVEPFDGAFDLEDGKKTIEVKPGQRISVEFKVSPFIRIESSYELNGTDLTVKYKMKRSEKKSSTKYKAAGVIVSSRTKFLSASNNVGGKEDEFSKMLSSLQLGSYKDGKELTSTVKLDAGKQYWMTVGGCLQGTDRWNYTPIVEIKVP